MKRLLGAAVCSLLVGLTVSSCEGAENENGTDPAMGPVVSGIEPIHVHGLGVNPDDEALFVATHTGLYRVAPGESELFRVGNNYQDTMGFTVVGPDRFLGSGHPDARTDLPPYLGLIESDSAGEEWESVSLLGRADFHVLEAGGDRVYGFGSDFESRREQFLVSDDGGSSWQRHDAPEALISLAVSPDDPQRIVASGRHSLFQSVDGGETWEPLPGGPGLLTWPSTDSLYLADKDGGVSRSGGPGSAWNDVGALGAPPAAFEAGAERLYAATHDGAIMESSDGGATWEHRSSTG